MLVDAFVIGMLYRINLDLKGTLVRIILDMFVRTGKDMITATDE